MRDQMSCRPNDLRAMIISVSTIAKPEKMAPATKYGGKIVVCQPGMTDVGEVERHDRVHREHQRRREAGEDQVRALVVVPVAVRAAPAERERRRRRSGGRLLFARSRSVARSGTRPMYQNSSETVKYVETANTSQISGLRKFGHMLIWFGIGNSQYAKPGRGRRGTAGRCSAQMTAKIVIASAARLMRRAPLLPEQEEDRARSACRRGRYRSRRRSW